MLVYFCIRVVEFYRYQKSSYFKNYFSDKNWSFDTVCKDSEKMISIFKNTHSKLVFINFQKGCLTRNITQWAEMCHNFANETFLRVINTVWGDSSRQQKFSRSYCSLDICNSSFVLTVTKKFLGEKNPCLFLAKIKATINFFLLSLPLCSRKNSVVFHCFAIFVSHVYFRTY